MIGAFALACHKSSLAIRIHPTLRNVFFLPIGTGAAGGLFSTIANDWYASGDTVALVNGVLGGLAAAAGCVTGGYLCDRMDRKMAYGLYGMLQAFGRMLKVGAYPIGIYPDAIAKAAEQFSNTVSVNVPD